MWDQPILHLRPSYQSWCGFFFNSILVGLPFILICDGSEWWLFCTVVVILMWLCEEVSRVFLCRNFRRYLWFFPLFFNFHIYQVWWFLPPKFISHLFTFLSSPLAIILAQGTFRFCLDYFNSNLIRFLPLLTLLPPFQPDPTYSPHKSQNYLIFKKKFNVKNFTYIPKVASVVNWTPIFITPLTQLSTQGPSHSICNPPIGYLES